MTFAAQNAAIAAGSKATPRGVAIPSRDAGRNYVPVAASGWARRLPKHTKRGSKSRGGFPERHLRNLSVQKSARDGTHSNPHAVMAF